ncbi:hypothetical protein BDP55DRAFT_67616 [Colletotrichum godetiae]|uniref:Uncharacterized protein n=1 Tax=Colletotrichum godetiae TaxID=1209918 RepID=A0AAJ0AQ90_9PEZI|nr:uncharacterized protein BDP55DRAFT_67616 [Colletotrichum godetiae]KAK1688379.1 hypothetical protein BDP55DRAFT_67616 [Colletotrichum godetiae]
MSVLVPHMLVGMNVASLALSTHPSSPLGEKKQHQDQVPTHHFLECTPHLLVLVLVLLLCFACALQGSNSTFLPGPFPFSLHPSAQRPGSPNLTATVFFFFFSSLFITLQAPSCEHHLDTKTASSRWVHLVTGIKEAHTLLHNRKHARDWKQKRRLPTTHE